MVVTLLKHLKNKGRAAGEDFSELNDALRGLENVANAQADQVGDVGVEWGWADSGKGRAAKAAELLLAQEAEGQGDSAEPVSKAAETTAESDAKGGEGLGEAAQFFDVVEGRPPGVMAEGLGRLAGRFGRFDDRDDVAGPDLVAGFERGEGHDGAAGRCGARAKAARRRGPRARRHAVCRVRPRSRRSAQPCPRRRCAA